VKRESERVYTSLTQHGLLLLQDAQLPSVVGLIVGEPIKGSWWGHPSGSTIFAIASELGDDPDVISTKLISGKVTFVERNLWSQIVSIGSNKASWQTRGLSEAAQALLKIIEKQKSIRTNSLPKSDLVPKPGKACDELEKRLLIHAEEFHTESGAHAKRATTWQVFASERKLDGKPVPADQAKKELETLIATLNSKFKGKGKLPWQ